MKIDFKQNKKNARNFNRQKNDDDELGKKEEESGKEHEEITEIKEAKKKEKRIYLHRHHNIHK